MARRKRGALPFQSIEEWHIAHPTDEIPAKDLFAVIPPAVVEQLSAKLTHSGPEALSVWQAVSVQLQVFRTMQKTASLQQNPNQFFANVGFFTTLASLFEDRLNALYVARSKMAFGSAYSEAADVYASVVGKAVFLREYGDIAAHDREAIHQYSKWRNAVAHQAHYNSGILCAEVFTAVDALFSTMQRMRNRQKTVLRTETKLFPTLDAQQSAVEAFCATLEGTVSRSLLAGTLGGSATQRVPFRHGAPVYVVKSAGATRVAVVDKQQTHTAVWNALHGMQWQVPVFEQRKTLVYTGIHTVTLHVGGGRVELSC